MLEVQSALIESLNKPTVNEFRIPTPKMEPQETRFWISAKSTNYLNIEQAEKNNEEPLDFSEKVLYVGSLNPAVSEGRFKQRILKRFCALYKANFARK